MFLTFIECNCWYLFQVNEQIWQEVLKQLKLMIICLLYVIVLWLLYWLNSYCCWFIVVDVGFFINFHQFHFVFMYVVELLAQVSIQQCKIIGPIVNSSFFTVFVYVLLIIYVFSFLFCFFKIIFFSVTIL